MVPGLRRFRPEEESKQATSPYTSAMIAPSGRFPSPSARATGVSAALPTQSHTRPQLADDGSGSTALAEKIREGRRLEEIAKSW